jgi:cobalt-zinc-cadmium efflux system protein
MDDDHHGHDHQAGHSHGHSHAPVAFGRAFAIGIALNTAYVVAEAAYGIAAHSLALLADAGHNLGDVLGLGSAWLAAVLIRRHPSGRYTYGLGGSTILAALFNAVLLLVVTGGIGWEAIRRLIAPEPTVGVTVMIVAGLGALVNGITALLFASGRKGDLNIRAAFQHMAADGVLSVGVAAAGAVILLTGWQFLDPAVSLIVSVAIVVGTWSLLRDAVNLSLSGVPRGVDVDDVTAFLSAIQGVIEVHDLHVWALSTTDTALTAHLVLTDDADADAVLRPLPDALRARFGIGHATIQLESRAMSGECELRPAHVV